ncbi:unnamed protein product, partial [Ectocarpus sp. 4 AP-2014]
ASAPEKTVEAVLDYLVENHAATIEPRLVREESVSFPLPKELRQLAT